ncbi:MAG: phosphotransferase, partial [Pseudoxanthomonas sp.]
VGPQDVPPDWPPLQVNELDAVLASYPDFAGATPRIVWHSPRPLSAAALVQTEDNRIFVKRHHVSVRTAACLEEEHRFIAHLRHKALPVVRVYANARGHTAVMQGDWTYEIHSAGRGEDVYRETTSWTPLTDLARAREAGTMLARLHRAAADYDAPQRSTHLLVARDDLIRADDPVAALQAQFVERSALAAWLQARNWPADFRQHLLPWHRGLADRLRNAPRLWAHNDWHASNLLWQDAGTAVLVSGVLDFGLASPTSALFDLATAIERNAIAWLSLEQGIEAVHVDTALALLAGYRDIQPLDPECVQLLADLLPLVHVDFALSEVEYFHAITCSPENAGVAYDTFLLGHAQWFGTVPGQTLLRALRAAA